MFFFGNVCRHRFLFFFQGWMDPWGFEATFCLINCSYFLLIVRTESRNGADLSLEVVKKSEPSVAERSG